MPMLAVLAVAAGATAGLVVGAGLALATAVTYVGIGMSVVGAVTGNKNMMKVGSIMGLAGGVMNLLNVGTSVASGAVSGAASAAGEVAGDGLAAAMQSSGADAIVDASMSEFALEEMTDEALSAWATENVAQQAVDAGAQAAASGVSTGAAPIGFEQVAEAATNKGLLGAFEQPIPSGGEALTSEAIDAASQGGMVGGEMTETMGVVKDGAASATGKATDVAKTLSNSVSGTGKAPGAVPPPGGDDKKSLWAGLPETTKAEIIKAGLSGAGEFFKGWSASEKAEWEADRAREQQTNLNAQPTIQRYQKPGGILGAPLAPKPIGG